MKYVMTILIALLLLSGPSGSLMAAPPQQNPDRAPGYHVVEEFDTPSRIANRFGMDVDELMRVNNITDPRRLNIGTVLIIPGSDGSLPSADASPVTASTSNTRTEAGTYRAPSYYVIQNGDTPASIADRFNMSVDELMRLNNISNPRRLKIGRVLIIPGSDGSLPSADSFPVTASTSNTSSQTLPYRAPSYYVIQNGDTPASIADRFNMSVDELMRINEISDPTRLRIGTVLLIPGSDGSHPDPIEKRMTVAAQNAPVHSPYYKNTWVTYYGRPNVRAMGILGEYSINDLVPLLRKQARAYDQVNGVDLGVMPAFHLVYGMATKGPSHDGDYLAFLSDEVVLEYIERAKQEGFAVILDIQIGALTPAESLQYGLPFLKHSNVHLALDPEFAMSHPNQSRPGNPIGFVTAEQINVAQKVMHQYMVTNNIQGRRILLLHQFQPSMIVRKERLDMGYQRIDLTTTADGWGGPWAKISKYNSFMSENSKFTGFKLFYRWDRPLLTPSEALGVTRHGNVPYVEITPNLIIYQ